MDPRELLAKEQDDGLIRRSFGLEIKSIDEKARSAHFVFSAATLDSYDEIVEQDWDLTRYQKNPVVLYNHNRGAMFTEPKHSLPIGYAKNVGVVNGQLEGDVFFASEKANPLAEQCWNCLQEGVLRAGSVGFAPGDVRSETINGKDIYRLSKNKLFEYSLTPIGACEDALANSTGESRDHEKLKTLAAKCAANTAPQSAEGNQMDLDKLQAEITRLTAENTANSEKATASEREAIDVKAKLSELQASFDAQSVTLKTLTAEKVALEGANIAAEVKLLEGKKITPSQTDDYIELRVTMGAEKFDAFVAKMPDLVFSRDVTGKNVGDAINTSTGRTNAAGSAVLKAAREAASKAANKLNGD